MTLTSQPRTALMEKRVICHHGQSLHHYYDKKNLICGLDVT